VGSEGRLHAAVGVTEVRVEGVEVERAYPKDSEGEQESAGGEEAEMGAEKRVAESAAVCAVGMVAGDL